MTTYATVFTFDSQSDKVALYKQAKDPVVYYRIEPSYYRQNPSGTWRRLKRKDNRPPVFHKKGDKVVFYFIDSVGKVDQVGAVLEFQQAIGPFDDEVAAAIRMAAPRPSTFRTTKKSRPAFELTPVGSGGGGFEFESTGNYSYTVTLITFPDLRKYWLDPEMDVEP